MYEINNLKDQLSDKFEIKDLGASNKILCLDVHRDQNVDNLYLSQKKSILRRYLNVLVCKTTKPLSISLVALLRLSSALSPEIKKEKEHMSGVPYTSVVGSIVYVMICTCSNISYDVNIVNKFMENPSKVHQQIVK